MDYLGNIYFYLFILIILVFLIAIFIANSIYFTDIYDSNSEKTSASQFQKLIFLNLIAVILLIISFFVVFYIMGNSVYFKNEMTKKTLAEETKNFNEKIKYIEKLNKENKNLLTERLKEAKNNVDSLFFEDLNKLKSDVKNLNLIYEDIISE